MFGLLYSLIDKYVGFFIPERSPTQNDQPTTKRIYLLENERPKFIAIFYNLSHIIIVLFGFNLRMTQIKNGQPIANCAKHVFLSFKKYIYFINAKHVSSPFCCSKINVRFQIT